MEYTIYPDGSISTDSGTSDFKKKLEAITGDIQLDPDMIERMKEYDTHKLFN